MWIEIILGACSAADLSLFVRPPNKCINKIIWWLAKCVYNNEFDFDFNLNLQFEFKSDMFVWTFVRLNDLWQWPMGPIQSSLSFSFSFSHCPIQSSICISDDGFIIGPRSNVFGPLLFWLISHLVFVALTGHQSSSSPQMSLRLHWNLQLTHLTSAWVNYLEISRRFCFIIK